MRTHNETTRFGANPRLDQELANKAYVDGQADKGLDLTTKGDLHGFSTVDERIPIGTNDFVLTADSAEALGIAWKVGGSGGSGQTFARVVKKVDESVTSSTTLQDDDELFFTPNVSKTYGFMLFLLVANDGTPDFKEAFSVPTGATILVAAAAYSPVFLQSTRDGTTAQSHTTSTGDKFLMIMGRVVMDTTAGDCNFQWSQNTSSATAEIVKEGSYLVVWEET